MDTQMDTQMEPSLFEELTEFVIADDKGERIYTSSGAGMLISAQFTQDLIYRFYDYRRMITDADEGGVYSMEGFKEALFEAELPKMLSENFNDVADYYLNKDRADEDKEVNRAIKFQALDVFSRASIAIKKNFISILELAVKNGYDCAKRISSVLKVDGKYTFKNFIYMNEEFGCPLHEFVTEVLPKIFHDNITFEYMLKDELFADFAAIPSDINDDPLMLEVMGRAKEIKMRDFEETFGRDNIEMREKLADIFIKYHANKIIVNVNTKYPSTVWTTNIIRAWVDHMAYRELHNDFKLISAIALGRKKVSKAEMDFVETYGHMYAGMASENPIYVGSEKGKMNFYHDESLLTNRELLHMVERIIPVTWYATAKEQKIKYGFGTDYHRVDFKSYKKKIFGM